MTERYWSVCAGTVVAWVCWLVGTTLVGLSCMGVLGHPFATLGAMVSMFGCMTMLRCWVQRAATHGSEAFALGQASMRVVPDR